MNSVFVGGGYVEMACFYSEDRSLLHFSVFRVRIEIDLKSVFGSKITWFSMGI